MSTRSPAYTNLLTRWAKPQFFWRQMPTVDVRTSSLHTTIKTRRRLPPTKHFCALCGCYLDDRMRRVSFSDQQMLRFQRLIGTLQKCISVIVSYFLAPQYKTCTSLNMYERFYATHKLPWRWKILTSLPRVLNIWAMWSAQAVFR